MIRIEIADRQNVIRITDLPLRQAVASVLSDHGPAEGEVSIAVVDDPTIHQLNQKYLQHDYATDVLSFLLDCDDHRLEGEVIVSAETAERQAGNYGWSPQRELLLYLIHGTLHLVGFDDHTEADRAAMRAQEQHYLESLGTT